MDWEDFLDITLISAPVSAKACTVFSLRIMLTRYLDCLEISLTSFCLTRLILVTCLLSFTFCLKVVSFWIGALSVSVLSSDESDSLSEVSTESLSQSLHHRLNFPFQNMYKQLLHKNVLSCDNQNIHIGKPGKICVLDIVWVNKSHIFYWSFCF